MKVIGIENRDTLLQEARKITQSDPEREFQHRVEIVILALKGISAKELETKGIVSRPTLNLWLKNVMEAGTFEALRSTPAIGRPRKLGENEMKALITVMNEDPLLYGYNNWDGKAIHDFIKKNYNEDICLRHCQRIKQELIKSGKVKIIKHRKSE